VVTDSDTGHYSFPQGFFLLTFYPDFQTSILGSKTQQGVEPLNSNKATEIQAVTDINSQAWTYPQKTGELQQDGQHVAMGYSGAGEGKNNPDLQSVRNLGPIPQGDWTILGPPVNTPAHGPYVLGLTPKEETETFRPQWLSHARRLEKRARNCIPRLCHYASARGRKGLKQRGS